MLRLPVALLGSLLAATALFGQVDVNGQSNTQPNSQPPGQIMGHVQNAVTGDPIPGAQVVLIRSGPIAHVSKSAPGYASCQPDGSFVFDNVPAGAYSLIASAPNYSPARFKNNASPNLMDLFNVPAGGQVAGLVMALQPYANLIGKVVDDAGQPVPHAQIKTFISVLLRGSTRLQPRSAATADETGQFELKGVPNGKIYVLASPAANTKAANSPPPSAAGSEPKLDLVSTFYPESLDLSGAVPIDVHSGQDQSDVEIHMKRAATFHIRGKVSVTASPGTRLQIEVSPRGSPMSDSSGHTASPDVENKFDIPGLVPGNYTIRVGSPFGNAKGPSSLQRILSRQDVSIAAGDVNGLVLSKTPQVSLTWHARADDENANLSNVAITLLSWDDPPANAVPLITLNQDGSRTITADPGFYLIRVSGVPSGSYVSSLQLNQSDAWNKVVDLSQGGAGQVDITFRKGLAKLDGSLVSNDNSVPAPATIVLVPESLAPDGSNLRLGSNGRTSSFSFANVPPGTYTVFAVAQFEYNAWQNPNFLTSLQGRGVEVNLSENDHKHVEISVIPASDLLQAMAQLGLSE